MPYILNEQQGVNAAAGRASQGLSDILSAKYAAAVRANQLDQQAGLEAAQRQKDIESAQGLQRAAPDQNVHVGSVSLGGRDPLRDLLRKKELEQPKLTPGQEAADKAFGKEYSDYVAGGGSEGLKKNIQSLEFAKEGLKQGDKYDRWAGFLPRMVREVISPAQVAREDAVKNAIQATLRQTLGAQFTEKEGQALLERAYNPRLPVEENVRRVEQAAQELKRTAAQKMKSAEQFERTGSLVGLGAAGGLGSPASAPQQQAPSYDGSSPLPPGASPEMKEARRQFLLNKRGK